MPGHIPPVLRQLLVEVGVSGAVECGSRRLAISLPLIGIEESTTRKKKRMSETKTVVACGTDWTYRNPLAEYSESARPTQKDEAALPTPRVSMAGTGMSWTFSALPV